MYMNSRIKGALSQGYDLSPIPVDELLSHAGLGIVIRHYQHQLERLGQYAQLRNELSWDLEKISKEMGEEGVKISDYKMARFFVRKLAEDAETARSRICYGMQVSERIGSLVANVAAIRVIGAESRLEYRAEDRGIRDLDLAIDVYEMPAEKDIWLINRVKQDAEEKAGIPVDILCPGLPITPDNMEHIMSVFSEPLSIRGFPVFWREQKYLDFLLSRKNEFFDKEVEAATSSQTL